MEKVFNIRNFKALINLGIAIAIISFVFILFFLYTVYSAKAVVNGELKGPSSTSSLLIPLKTTHFSIPSDVVLSKNHKTAFPMEVTGKFGIYLNDGDSQNQMAILLFGYILVAYIILMWMLFYLRKILLNVEKGEIFTQENISRLKTLGIISLIYPVYKFLESKVLLHLVFSRLQLPDGFSPDIASHKEITIACILLTFIFFTMASFFQYGKKIKEDQELTI
jgi:hypothetical protein